MLIYRIVHKNWSTSLFASGKEGRWNREGNKVIYAAESIPLAFLENMVRRQGIGFNHDFKIMFIDVPDTLKISVIDVPSLQENWRDIRNYTFCQPAGNKWYDEAETSLLKVPSAILPEAFNYVINAKHPGFENISLIEVTELVPDERIESILKQYGKG